jgi:geranylgeranyl diphosphate synthase type II
MAAKTGPQSLKDVLREKAALATAALDQVLTAPDEPSRDLYEAMRYMALSGGKKMRPALVLLACEACGSAPDAALPAACAVEMVHTYSLIHDDLPAMDNDDLRHGKPSCHKQFGEAMAILAGDALLTEAFAVLATRVADPARAKRLVAELAQAAGAVGMVGGQAADLKAERSGHADERLLEVIHRRKTAALIAAGVVMGAVSAGASEHWVMSLREYGNRLGLAFQVADDVLDATATTEALGKTAGKDVAAGKLTFVTLYGLAAARLRARAEADSAIDALAGFGHEGDWLRDLARFVVERTH